MLAVSSCRNMEILSKFHHGDFHVQERVQSMNLASFAPLAVACSTDQTVSISEASLACILSLH